MKKIDVSFALDPVRQPVMARSLSHLQESYQEAIDAIVKSLAYDPTKAVILFGCVNSTVAPIYTISAGAIYWLGEIYLVDAVTFTSVGPAVAVASIITTYQTGDPTVFSDNSSHNVHQIRKIQFATGVSGSTIFDFSVCKTLARPDIGYDVTVYGNKSWLDNFYYTDSIFYEKATSSAVGFTVDLFKFTALNPGLSDYVFNFSFETNFENTTGGTPHDYSNRIELYNYTTSTVIESMDIVETGVTSINQEKQVKLFKRLAAVPNGTVIGLRFINNSDTSLSYIGINDFRHSIQSKY